MAEATVSKGDFEEGQIVEVNDDGMWVKATLVTFSPEKGKWIAKFAKGEEIAYFKPKKVRKYVESEEAKKPTEQAKPKPVFSQMPKKSQEEVQMDKETRALGFKERGNNFFKKGKNDLAINMYTKAIELCPTVAVFYNNRAMAYVKAKQWSLAEQDCTAAISLDSKLVKAYFRRGISFQNQALGMLSLDYLDKAEKDFNKVLKLAPGNKPAENEIKKISMIRPKMKVQIQKMRNRDKSDDVDEID